MIRLRSGRWWEMKGAKKESEIVGRAIRQKYKSRWVGKELKPQILQPILSQRERKHNTKRTSKSHSAEERERRSSSA